MVKEIICLHIGQAGVQIGSACWELYNIEHGILPDGSRKQSEELCGGFDSFTTYYDESPGRRYTPRSIFVDTEPSVIDEIRNNQYRELFRPDTLVNGKEDAANNYGRGYGMEDRDLLSNILEAARSQAEACESMEGFFLFHSMAGGTGSGVTTLVMEEFTHMFAKKNMLEFMVFPSPRLSTSTVEPYNAVLSASGTMDLCSCGFMVDNESMYRICSNQLDMQGTTYGGINRLLSQVISSLTAPMRFDGSLNVDLTEFQTNLVPFPRIHFPLLSYAPFRSAAKAARESMTIGQLTRLAFHPSSNMLDCHVGRGKYIACCMLYRGTIPPYDVYKSIRSVKESKLRFVNWCPTGFKVGINYQPPCAVPGSDLAKSTAALCLVSNVTAIAEVWARVDYKFDLLFSKRSFVHWFTCEGMEEEDFIEARDNLAQLEKDFEECCSDVK